VIQLSGGHCAKKAYFLEATKTKYCIVFLSIYYRCSTLVDSQGVHVGGQGKWGNCAASCPKDGSKSSGNQGDKGFIK